MRRGIYVLSGLVVMLTVACGGMAGDSIDQIGSAVSDKGHPAAKATIDSANLAILDVNDMEWSTILSSKLKTGNNRNLVVWGSLECGLFTDTKVSSKNGKKESAQAESHVYVRVLIDGEEANPGIVEFCGRSQTLLATFQGLLTNDQGEVCLTTDPETGAVIIDEECLRPEEVQLIVKTMNASSFTFYLPVGADVHNIEMQAMISTNTDVSEGGEAKALASIGKGTVFVEEHRFAKQ